MSAGPDPSSLSHAQKDALIAALMAQVASLTARVAEFEAKLGLPPKTPDGFVTFAHFTCQRCCALKDRTKENQSLGALDVGARSTENGLFLASVTMPPEHSSVFGLGADRLGRAITFSQNLRFRLEHAGFRQALARAYPHEAASRHSGLAWIRGRELPLHHGTVSSRPSSPLFDISSVLGTLGLRWSSDSQDP